MKYVKTFEVKYENLMNNGVSCAVITSSELEERKKKKFNSMRSDKDMSYLSDEDLQKIVEVFYKLEIKFGFIKIKE